MSITNNPTTLFTAKMVGNGIIAELSQFCERIEVAGSVRRGLKLVNDLDLVIIPKPECMDKLKAACMEWHPDGNEIFSSTSEYPLKWGAKMATFNYCKQLQVDLYFANEKTFPIIYLIRTGSKEHNIWLCSMAGKKGMYLAADGSGLYADRDKKKPLFVKSEEDIYRALGGSFLTPSERDGNRGY